MMMAEIFLFISSILVLLPAICHTSSTNSYFYLQIKHAMNRSRRRSAKSLADDNHVAFLNPSKLQHHCQRTKTKHTSVITYQDTFTSPKLSPEEENVLSSKFSKLRSLGIDYGLSRTGIAVTTGGYRPRPLAILSGYTKQYTLRNTTKIKEITGSEDGIVTGIDNSRLVEAIVSYATSERVTNLVLGLPLHKNGSISEQSNITRKFGMELLECVRRECGMTMNVTLWDERYTSKEAASRIVGEMMAKNRDLGSIDLQGCLDDEAACIILEHYYQVLGKDAEMLRLDNELEEECRKVYELKLDQEEQQRQRVLEDRARMWNARREMIERDRGSQVNTDAESSSKKKKKRKKKK
jgi:putative transcription antitermination factor YqgF